MHSRRRDLATYVLRSYCSTRLMLAEGSGHISRDLREAILGHNGGVASRYNVGKRWGQELLDEARREYARASSFLETNQRAEKPDVLSEAKALILEAVGATRLRQLGSLTDRRRRSSRSSDEDSARVNRHRRAPPAPAAGRQRALKLASRRTGLSQSPRPSGSSAPGGCSWGAWGTGSRSELREAALGTPEPAGGEAHPSGSLREEDTSTVRAPCRQRAARSRLERGRRDAQGILRDHHDGRCRAETAQGPPRAGAVRESPYTVA